MKLSYLHLNYLLLIVGGISTPGSDCLKDVYVSGQPYVRRGEDVILSCNYDLEKDSLYALKWYRFREEFYKFVPKESPPQMIFPLPGIQVDVARSNARQVVLKNVSMATTGRFKCVVSAESTFKTLMDLKDLTVVVIGYDVPQLQLDQISYHPGDVVTANCTAHKTFPSPNVTWYINDREEAIPSKIHTTSTPDQIDPAISTTVSTLKFDLPDSYLPAKLTCRVRLFELYDVSSMKRVQPNPRQYSVGGPDTLLRSNKISPPSIKNTAQHNQSQPNHFQNICIYFFITAIAPRTLLLL